MWLTLSYGDKVSQRAKSVLAMSKKQTQHGGDAGERWER